MKWRVALCSFVLFLLFAMPVPTVAMAATALPDGAILNDPSLTPEKMAEIEKLTQQKEAALGLTRLDTSIQPMSLNTYGRLTKAAPNYRQETSYFCGPASTRQSLAYHKANSGSGVALPSQTTLAGRIGTTTSGSSTSGIVSTLNSYNGTFGFIRYIGSNIVGTTNPYETFVNRIGQDLRQPGGVTNSPSIPITLMQTSKIPRYNGHPSRHYMSISGIDDTVSPMIMRSVDPNNNSAYYGVYWDPVGSTTVNGLCRACYQADLDGTNLAMAW